MRLHRVSNRSSITLGRELGRGGEGVVYPVIGAPDLVAKIYLKPTSSAKAEKLRSMARRASPALLRVAAWPVDVLADETGAVRGFLMPKVSARQDVHQLYSPKSRRRAFPAVDFRFVVRVAANIARAFAQVHAVGNVIGDVNHGNALIGRDGTVVLIDCDSFQVRDAARIFTCDVGVPLFTAPELAGQSFRGLRRTANHDAFGLAVLLFHLLYVGRHPFAGIHADGEMTIERAIAESRFVYGVNAASLGMTPPPGTLPLDVFGQPIARLFEKAFAPPEAGPRPTANEWVDALHALENELEICRSSPRHFPPRGGAQCCWCELEGRTGTQLFGAQPRSEARGDITRLENLWSAIIAVPRPEPARPIDEREALKGLATRKDPLGRIGRALVSWALVGMGVYVLLMHPGEHTFLGLGYFGAALALRLRYMTPWWKSERAKFLERARKNAQEKYAAMALQWNALCKDHRFENLLAELGAAKRALLELPQRRATHLQALDVEAERLQRVRYLEMFRIDKAKLPSVSARDIQLLAQYDIDTAEEALRHNAELYTIVRGGVAREIEAWANACARNFQYDVTRGAAPEDVQEIDEIYQEQQDSLLNRLRDGSDELAQLSADINASREETRSRLHAAIKAHDAAQKERA